MKNYKDIIRKIFGYALNNIFINNIIILLQLEDYFKKPQRYWKNYKITTQKSLEENAGFSNYQDVRDTRDKLRIELEKIKTYYLSKRAKVLDIGCGPGLFLSGFEKDFDLTGVDINKEMIAVASQKVPHAKFILGDFLECEFNERFNLIYSISVLQYIPRMNIDKFFKKIIGLL